MIYPSSFKIDNTTFLQVGMDPKHDFQSMIHIFKKSRFLTITSTFLTKVYDMKNIIINKLDEPSLPPETDLFLHEYMAVSICQRRDEKLVCFECILHDHRLRLSKFQFQRLCKFQNSIFQECKSKHMLFRPLVKGQLEQLAEYLKKNFPLNKVQSHDKLMKFAQLVEESELRTVLPSCSPCFYGQIQYRACEQLVNRWIQLMVRIFFFFKNTYFSIFNFLG